MVIYGEYLFLENFITGILILTVTGELAGYKAGALRMVTGGVMCGAYSFVILADMSGAWPLVSKLAFSFVLVAAVFFSEKKPLVRLIKATILFYIVSFLFGGITIGVLYMTARRGISNNGAVYTETVTYGGIVLGLTASWILGRLLTKWIKGKVLKSKVILPVTVSVGEHSWEMKAFVDTGNFLREPISGETVAVICPAAAKIIRGSGAELRYCVIPYKTLGKRGILEGFHADNIRAEGRSLGSMALAVSSEDFAAWNNEEKYDLLLQQEVIQRGILNDERRGLER